MPRHSRMISISAIGLYIPGIVARITGKIFKMNGNIVDVEENCGRGMFSIFLVVDFTESTIDIDRIFRTFYVKAGCIRINLVCRDIDKKRPRR